MQRPSAGAQPKRRVVLYYAAILRRDQMRIAAAYAWRMACWTLAGFLQSPIM